MNIITNDTAAVSDLCKKYSITDDDRAESRGTFLGLLYTAYIAELRFMHPQSAFQFVRMDVTKGRCQLIEYKGHIEYRYELKIFHANGVEKIHANFMFELDLSYFD